MAAAIGRLEPERSQRDHWELEWLVKAGEGGAWQEELNRSGHPLTVDGPGKLRHLREAGRRLPRPLRVTPWVVIRGRPEWNEGEWALIAQCAEVAGRVVLDWEPREPNGLYWNGPTEPAALLDQYIEPLLRRVRARAPAADLELDTLPRKSDAQKLGGQAVVKTFLQHVSSASWQCYDLLDPRGMNVAAAMAQVNAWAPPGWQFRIPVVQRSRIGAWADTPFCAHGMEVWHLDGD